MDRQMDWKYKLYWRKTASFIFFDVDDEMSKFAVYCAFL